ncbi:MAG: LysR family transcriptional regulator [Clostridia bacterium]|nr:LysR family transcriptional regulator [Clostridia bacterium]
MTLSGLKYFVTAAKHGNISRAAEELSVSQPSVSQAIKALEGEFGLPLISRERTGFSLTEGGKELYLRASTLLSAAASLSAAMTEMGRGRLSVRVGIPPMIGNMLLDRILGELRARYPELSVSFGEGGREELISGLESGSLDMAFISHSEPLPEGYSSLPVGCEETVLAVSDKNPLSTRHSVTPEELADEPLALFGEGYFITERVMKLFAERGLTARVMHTSTQLSAQLKLISANVASGFLFRSIAKSREGIVAVSVEPPLFTDISLVWRSGGLETDGMKKFKELIGEKK